MHLIYNIYFIEEFKLRIPRLKFLIKLFLKTRKSLEFINDCNLLLYC